MVKKFKNITAILLIAIIPLLPLGIYASQHDMEITTLDANTGPTLRAQINSALQALVTNNSGSSEPAVTRAYQFWADTTTGMLKIRNSTNTAWVTIGSIASAYLGHAYLASPNTFVAMNNFTANQKMYGDSLILRFKDTGAGGSEWGIRSTGGNFEVCENTGTEAAPTWTPRSTFNTYGIVQSYAANAFYNVGISASVSANAITVSLTGIDGTTPSASNEVKIGFRDSSLTSGVSNIRSVTSGTTVTISSGSTLGFTANEKGRIYVWALDNSGTVELGASHRADLFPEDGLNTTTAEGGSGASDSASLLYSTTAGANVPIRMLGYLDIQTDSTPGWWPSGATKVQVMGPGIVLDTKYRSQSSYATAVDIASPGGGWVDADATNLQITFTPPKSGRYRAEFEFTHYTVGSAGAGVISKFGFSLKAG